MAGLRKVLIVEDNDSIRDLYHRILSDSHHELESASSADELYQKLKTFTPDCVLLDVMLPGISGLEILKELRTNPTYGCQLIKIVIITNVAQSDISDEAMKNGADGFIIKTDIQPMDLPKIIASLEK